MLLKVTVCRAENLRCNERRGPFHSFARVWVHDNNKLSTNVDEERDSRPIWNETLSIPLSGPISRDISLKIAIFDARTDDNQCLIGIAELNLNELIMEVGVGRRTRRTLQLQRYSGRPRGHVVFDVLIRKASIWSKTKKFVKKTKKFEKAVVRFLKVAAPVSQILATA